jgi:succinate-semialdehyde dehydrogenase/glutarate-semialdehyde dehydrogenase
MSIATLNPATGELFKTFQPLTDKEVDQKIAVATSAFGEFRNTSIAERSRWMYRAAEILESEKMAFGKLMTLEMGKTLKSAAEEAAKCAWACRYYAENAEKFLADELVQTNATKSFIRYQPLGIILAVMPWNFPFWQAFRFIAPALMAGNVGLLKHASNVPQCALAIEEILRRAGFPKGVFQTLLIGSDKVQRILEDPRVKAATLTGSEPAGMSVASIAGKHIKKTVLELGGSDPYIVMPSANVEEAAAVAVKARCINNGQSCIAAKRFIIHESVFEQFSKLFVEGMNRLNVGDPMNENTDIGPIATSDLRDELDKQVQSSIAKGAKLLTGGKKVIGPGYFYAPTVLTDIPKDSPAYSEEMFGPVAMLFKVNTVDEAITLANDTLFGLGSSAWTNDSAEQKKFIDEIESGLVFINSMVASDPRLPFGGVKRSGYGRELGVFGIREFVNIKTVSITTGK